MNKTKLPKIEKISLNLKFDLKFYTALKSRKNKYIAVKMLFRRRENEMTS